MGLLPILAPIFGAAIQAGAANRAARAGTDAANSDRALQEKMFNMTRKDLSPYRRTGRNALGRLNDPDAFETSPGYEFRLGQGQDAISAMMAKRGQLFSGATGQALTDYNQNAASNEYGNWFGQQFGLAQMGQNAATQTGGFGANFAAQSGNAGYNAANAIGAGAVGTANAINGGIENALGAWQYQQQLNNQPNYNA